MLKSFSLAAGMVLIAAAAQATVLVPADLNDLTRLARVIARGRVVDVTTRWTDDRRAIETLVTLDPETYLKGSMGESIRFRVPGGQLGRYRRVVVGAPQFAAGQHVVVFLGAQSPGVPYVIGLSQGVFRVEIALDGSMQVTPPPFVRMADGGATRISRGDLERRPMALSAFERQVRVLAGGPR